MIALVRRFDRDILQAVLVEQVAGKLRTRPGVAVGGTAVTFQDAPDP